MDDLQPLVADLRQQLADAQRQLEECVAQRDDALAREAALAEVLQAVNSKSGDLSAVFALILEKAHALCGVANGSLQLYDGTRLRAVAVHSVPEPLASQLREGYVPGAHFRSLIDGADFAHVPDMAEIDGPMARVVVEAGIRSLLSVALRKDGKLLGQIVAARTAVQPFSDKQIALLQSFAAHAVIAMENARLLTEQREALERQTATAEVLQVINASPGDLAPVFEAMLEKAMRLCGAAFGILRVWDGSRFHGAASRGVPAAYAEFLARNPQQVQPGSIGARIIAGERLVHVVDVAEDKALLSGDPHRRALVELGGARTSLVVALTKDNKVLGALQLYRQHVQRFSEKQIALLENFAGQAVIAMENARLITETREALERQTATIEVLETINSSPGDLSPVFETILAKAMLLCDAAFGTFSTFDGQRLHTAATRGVPEAFARFRRSNPPAYGPETGPGRLMAGEDLVHEIDAADSEAYRRGDPSRRAIVDLGGARTILNVALRKENVLLGAMSIYRQAVRPFSDNQIELLQGFAAQAVIAMDNARLLAELRQRTDALTESLEYQTAIGEVLTVISRSAFDLAPVLQTLTKTALRLCEAEMAFIVRREGEGFRVVTAAGATPESARNAHDYQRYQETLTIAPDRGSVTGRVALEGRAVQIPDIAADPEYKLAGASALGKIRTQVGVPLIREGVLIGVMVLSRQRVEPFSERQVDLLQTFADQAVIAMENARLLGELREALDQQTATGDVLRTISRSSTDLEQVLETLVETVARLCRGDQAYLFRRDGNLHHLLASAGASDEVRDYLRAHPFEPSRGNTSGRAVLERRTIHIPDVLADPEYSYDGISVLGFRTALGIPLLREDTVVGVFVVSRMQVAPFSDKEIELASGFADQALIAIENARLFEELRDRQAELRVTLDNTGDGVVMFDADFRLASCNRNFQEMLDIPDAFVTSRPGYDDYLRLLVGRGELGEGDPEGIVADFRERATRQWSTERTRPDGRIIEVRNNPVPDGGAVLIYSDITERKRAEAAIAAARDAAEEALEQQTATVDILKVIASSPNDVQPVFDVVVKAAVRLCGAQDSLVVMRHGSEVVFQAHEGPLGGDRGARWPLVRENVMGRAIIEGRTVHVADASALAPGEFDLTKHGVALYGFKAIVAAPLMRKGSAIGALLLRRREAGAYTPRQIELLETFAAQAVIAIENVRLFNDLREALEQQTATADILRAISESPTNVQPVLDAVVKAALRFCGAPDALIVLRDGDVAVYAAHEGPIEARRGPVRLSRQTAPGRAMSDGKVVQIADLQSAEGDDFQEGRALGAAAGFRSALAAPLLRDDVAIGAISLRRPEAGAFTPRQVELLESFAAQAVIAIENVRLFTELREALEQQTATADILSVISRSPTDVQPVLEAVTRAALRFCGAPDALVLMRDGDDNVVVAHQGTLTATLGLRRPITNNFSGQALLECRTLQIADVEDLDPAVYDGVLALARQHKWRASAAAPMMHAGKAIGCVVLRKPEPGLLSPRQIALLETFAAQAVIAIENVRLFTELRDSLERLKAAQANLIQSEKMASLGQLTAGIAHEIKNPLNFVNNFAALSVELLDELKEAAVGALATLDDDTRAEVEETMDLLTGNLAKIAEHGKRADGIVRSMLSHSRGGSGDWAPSDINALVEEALNLAYHGARSQDKEFNVTLERDLEKNTRPIDVVPQDVMRVFLNLFGNGFYAVGKRRTTAKQAGFRPTLKVSTRDLGEAVEVRVRDNGIGILPDVRDKLFEPFFTTKPTGEGTGLGLSISYDIVTQQHGGSIEVESEPGSFTEFTVRLPRRRVQTSSSERA